MKTIRYFSIIVVLLMLAVATSCSDSDAIKSIEDEVTHTATMTLSGGVRGFDDSRADAEGWSDGDMLYLNFSTNDGVVSGVATYNKSIDSWSVTYSGTLTEGTATKCEAYFFDGQTSQNGSEVTFNALTAVYTDKSAYYVCKDGAISLTAMLVPQSARFRFKGTPGTEFSVSGCESYSGFGSQSLQQSSTNVAMKIEDDGYSPYFYGFISVVSKTLIVDYEGFRYSRIINSSNLSTGKSGWYLLPTEDNFDGWEKEEVTNTKTITVNGVTFRMKLVAAGTFTMGATSEQKDANSDERPSHQVTITKDYYIGETEVTQALWYAVMRQKPTSDGDQWIEEKGLGNNYPAYYISWNDCQEFITKLNQLTGLTFRLPTEAEWEYAARGGHKKPTQTLYSGSNSIDDIAWYKDNSSSKSHEVGGKVANALGLYDMSGNEYEWCYDWYGSYSSEAQTDPIGPSTGDKESRRVLRGGSWLYAAGSCRVALRNYRSMSERNDFSGMRLVLGEPLPEPEPEPEPDPNDKIITANGVTFKMKFVEAGTFTMGATSEQTGANSDERPSHQVTITKDYYIGETEVTQALWYAVMRQKPTSDGDQWIEEKGLGNNYPAYYISWDDCQEFITKLNQLTGLTFRLPTEAEWEYAARGGHKKPTQTLYSGSNTIADVAWYKDNSSSKAHEVAGKAANALGLYDMSGNEYEWCYDWYGSYSSEAQTDPIGPSTGDKESRRVLRGGSWLYAAGSCRVALRNYRSMSERNDFSGMRLVLGEPLPEPEPEPVIDIESDPITGNMSIKLDGIFFKMINVKAGTFMMGATYEQMGAQSNESPAHQVTLTKDYYLGETEVTQALWYAVMGYKPTSNGNQWYKAKGLDDNYPAYYISWDDCQEFISKLNQLTGLKFRLPTEAEWEYAARGGNKATTQTLYSGSNTIGDVAWYSDNSSSSTHEVAGKTANALGLYDLSGNVCEWCNDLYGSYSSSSQTDPTGPTSGSSSHVYRGGSWYFKPTVCRVARREFINGGRTYDIGMRLALTKQ